jgi:hypothetical protein
MSYTWIDDEEALEYFKKEYEANVVTSNRRYRRVKYNINTDGNLSSFPGYDEIEDVEMIDIVMPKENLTRLISHMDSFLYRQESRERELRYLYGSLNKAWEQYQLILALVDDGKFPL